MYDTLQDVGKTNVQNHQSKTLTLLVHNLNETERRLDKIRLSFFILGCLGTAIIVLGFVWTFISYRQSQRISLSGGVAAVVAGLGGVLVDITRTRRTRRYISRVVDELDTLSIPNDSVMPVMRAVSEMSVGEGRKYPFQIPMLIILPGMAMFNSLHNFNHTEGCPVGNDHFTGLTQSEQSMCVLDLLVGFMGLCVSMCGVIYFTNKLFKRKGAWTASKLNAIINTLFS